VADYFVVDTYGDMIPASPEQPTTLRHLSGEAVSLTEVREGGVGQMLAPGASVVLTTPHRASSLGANVSMTRGES
jgi:hypothetical protein